jgi:superoxide dismutase
LPELDYDYDPLEPHISGQINELHHSNHHAAYVKGANDALAKLEEARVSGDHSGIFAQLSRRKGSERAIQRPKSAAGQSE